MPETAEDIGLVITVLRRLRGWNQPDLVARSEVGKSSLSTYEAGTVLPGRDVLEHLAAVVGAPMWLLDGALVPVIAFSRQVLLGAAAPSAAGAAALEIPPDQARSAADLIALTRFLAPGDDAAGDAMPAVPGEQDGAAADPWAFLPAVSRGVPLLTPDLATAFERLVDCACADSRRAAAHDARHALALARLARQVAELAPGEEAWRSALQSKTWAFEANALRVAAYLRAADAAFTAAWDLRRLATGVAEIVFPEWRLLDLEASLRREQRRFGTALELLDRALTGCPPEARGRILLNQAATLEEAGRIAPCLAVLAEAAPLVDAAGEPRDRMVVRFNTIVILWHLGRLHEAEASLAELRLLVQDLGNDLDWLRFRWLSARVAAGLARRDEALAEYAALLREYSRRGNAHDAALVSLDTAIVYLEQGRTLEVAALAQAMLWIFDAQQIHREALAALRLFHKAAESHSATADLARQVRHYLERAQHNLHPFTARRSRRPHAKRRRGLPDRD